MTRKFEGIKKYFLDPNSFSPSAANSENLKGLKIAAVNSSYLETIELEGDADMEVFKGLIGEIEVTKEAMPRQIEKAAANWQTDVAWIQARVKGTWAAC